MSSILLSICIPTYNRAEYLRKCLEAFFSQLSPHHSDLVEICVSDNDSPDNTTETVRQLIKEGRNIDYFKQVENIGADRNVTSCFNKAKGKYVWIFADDDFLLPGYLPQIIDLLKENNFGVVHIAASGYNKEEEIVIEEDNKIRYTVYEDSLSFFKNINYNITFATSHIINKQSILPENWSYRFQDSSLNQLNWTIPAIFYNKINLVVHNPALACKWDNTGGYKLFEVFGKNFNYILDYFIKKGINKEIKPIINNNLLSTFFPKFVNNRSDKFVKENYFLAMLPTFWKYKLFWRNIVFKTNTDGAPSFFARMKFFVKRKLSF